MVNQPRKLSQLSSEEKDELIHRLYLQIQKLELRIKELEGRLNKNSRNSHKPPSSDGLNKPNPKSQRGKSNRKSGGQKGHEGHTLDQVKNPDFIEEYRVDCCINCQRSLQDSEVTQYEIRQEFEIPASQMQVTEYRAGIVVCPQCGQTNKAEFPEHITQPVQYGHRVNALVEYYSQAQLLPYGRLKEIFHDIHGLPLSEGTLYNVHCRYYEKLARFEEVTKKVIQKSALAHFDESGIRIKKQLQWLHVASTSKLTYYAVHPKRGSVAMEAIGLLPKFKGRAIHDHWWPYFQYDCKHGLCNAHHLRELRYHHEEYDQSWCLKMSQFLVLVKGEIEKKKTQGKESFKPKKCVEFKKKYDAILKYGLKEIPVIKYNKVGKRGKQKQHPSKNLWDRLFDYSGETLAFMYDWTVPFTNNQGEQDIRMNKVKQKISGCFRSFLGAQIFCRARSYISTVKKEGINVLDALTDVLKGQEWLPPISLQGENTS